MASLSFDRSNELDRCLALGSLNRVVTPGWHLSLACLPAEAGPAG